MPTTLSVRADVRDAARFLGDVQLRQVPFATKQAINAVMLEGQRAQLALMQRTFIERRPDFAQRSVKIDRGGFATKTNPVGRIGIMGPRSDVYAKFEDGGVKTPHGHYLAVPRVGSLARPRAKSPARSPSTLRADPSIRTFVRPFKDGSGRGIFGVRRLDEAMIGSKRRTGQRIGKVDVRRAKPTLLYTLVPRASIADSLDFVSTITNAVQSGFRPNFDRALAEAMRTAR